jgi:cyclophilin family peptidyl-prolyl cis-trans isomerase
VLALEDTRGADLGKLAELAGNPNAAVRVGVARQVGGLAVDQAAPLLGGLAHDADAGVRAAACAASGRLITELAPEDEHRQALAAVLLHALADPAPEVRSAAAWGLGIARLDGAGGWLTKRLAREPAAGVRAAILSELWRVPGKEWIATAAKRLGDTDAEVRFAAAWSLARSGAPAAADALRRAAGDTDPAVRVAAMSAPRRGSPVDLWDAAVTGASDADPRVREASLDALAAMMEKAPGSHVLPPAVVDRVERLVGSPDPLLVQERLLAVRLAGAAGCCATELARVVDGDATWIAGEALAALGREGAKEARARVQAWLASTDDRRRRAAVAAATGLPDGQAMVLPLLHDAKAGVRLASVEALQGLPGDEVTEGLRGRLEDGDGAVRAAAVEALEKRHASPDATVLADLLAREEGAGMPDAAAALVRALAASLPGDAAARGALESAERRGDPVVARQAWAALHAHGEPGPPPPVNTGHDPAYYRKVEAWAGEPHWLEVVTVRGTMVVALDVAGAPLDAYRVAALAEQHSYDGLTFHRVVPDFVVQGGDPRGDGWGGPGWSLRDELTLEPYRAGTVGLATSGPDTAGSQFFVTLTAQPHLTGRYPLLGRLTAGLDVARRIRPGDTILRVEEGTGTPPEPLPVWYGPLSPGRLDAGITGWKAGRESYQPQPRWMDLLRTATLHYGLDVAMGTWCSDSREQVPRLQKVLEALGARAPFAPPRLIGVDRSKEIDPASWPYGALRAVPTITVTAGGSPVGQIVETPASGSIEEDLVRILAPLEGWQLGGQGR